MKKVDLHIHTIPTISDAYFQFSLEKLKDYISKMNIDCIAITNHNLFDLEQFNLIKETLEISIFPGIEINLEKGHLLLISENNELYDFDIRCKKVTEQIKDKEDFLTVEKFKEIYSDLSKYILIPHFDKKPKIKDEIISELSDYIKAGEVQSPKKFIYSCKDKNSLVPVIFSDLRFHSEMEKFSTRQTYFDLSKITFAGLKSCLCDKNKVFLSQKEGNKFFQALENGLELSTGLNVILGERSSGKSYTLDRIFSSNENVKYIRQFSLLETDEEESIKKFNNQLNNKNSNIFESYLEEFKNVVNEVLAINLEKNDKDLENYLDSLLKSAKEHERKDIFSKSALYNERVFSETDTNSLKQLIKSVEVLIENKEYRDLINKHISEDSMRNLIVDLIYKYRSVEEQNKKKRWLNDIIINIKSNLQLRSVSTVIKDVDFFKVQMDKKKIDKFIEITNKLKTEKEIYSQEVQDFKVIAKTKLYLGAMELKQKSGKRTAFSDAFQHYDNPYDYLNKLKQNEDLENAEYYKYFINTEFQILNKHGCNVSGGERSEFNLLQAIKDAQQYNMLLIDEPESSFDNLFLINEVNTLIKEISKNIPVIIVTHNNTIGASIKPDYLIYTKKEINGGVVDYKLFSGYPSDKKLFSLDGESISNYNILLDCLEAGETAYKDRGHSYEILED